MTCLKKLIKIVFYSLCILFINIIYLLASTAQYGYYVTLSHYYANYNTFQKIEDSILTGSESKNLGRVIDKLNEKYPKYTFSEINNGKNIEIKRLFKEFGWNEKFIIINYSLNWKLSSYNNSSKVSKRISGNRRYRSDVNGRQSDDF